MVGSEREREREGSMRGTPVTATFVERLFSPVSVRPQKDTPKVKKYDSIRGRRGSNDLSENQGNGLKLKLIETIFDLFKEDKIKALFNSR